MRILRQYPKSKKKLTNDDDIQNHISQMFMRILKFIQELVDHTLYVVASTLFAPDFYRQGFQKYGNSSSMRLSHYSIMQLMIVLSFGDL